MKNFFVKNILYLLTALGVGVAIYLAVNWSTMPVLQRMVGPLFIALMLHEWEEFKFPGGFAEMMTSNLNFSLVISILLNSWWLGPFSPSVLSRCSSHRWSG